MSPFHCNSSLLLAQSDPRRSRLDLQPGPSVRVEVKLLINPLRTKTRTRCYSLRLRKDQSPTQFEYRFSYILTILTNPHFTILPTGITWELTNAVEILSLHCIIGINAHQNPVISSVNIRKISATHVRILLYLSWSVD